VNSNTTALTFQSKTFDVIDQKGQPWLTMADIATVLYRRGTPQSGTPLLEGGDQSGPPPANAIRQVQKLYQRHADEFTSGMTSLIEMATSSGKQNIRIFSLRGAHLLAMFARTQVAKEFRVWVLDILDREFAFKRGANDVLTIEQADLLRETMTLHCARLPKKQQGAFMVKGWSKLKSHFKVGYRQIPQEQITEALSIVTRHAAEWELVEDEVKRPAQVLPDGRWLVEVESGRIATCKDAFTYHSVPAQGIPALVREPGLLPIDLLPRIIAAANERLNIWVDNQLSVARHRVKPA